MDLVDKRSKFLNDFDELNLKIIFEDLFITRIKSMVKRKKIRKKYSI